MASGSFRSSSEPSVDMHPKGATLRPGVRRFGRFLKTQKFYALSVPFWAGLIVLSSFRSTLEWWSVFGNVVQGVFLGNAVARLAIAWARYAEPAEDDHLQAHPDTVGELTGKDAKWCTDCGQRFIKWDEQQGFDAKTGEPRMINFMACPDWSQEAQERAREAHYASPFSIAVGFVVGFECGNTVRTKAKAFQHNGHMPAEVVGTCPGCVNDMVKAGAISRAKANEMLGVD